jgi:quinol-cytochrome oxidoreductase complex cytochrome b subunit
MITIAALVAVAHVVAGLTLKPMIGFEIRALTGPMTLWPAWVIVTAGVLGGFLTDDLHPRPGAKRR